MSVLEIKQQIARLSADEQSEIEAFLKARRIAEAGDFRARGGSAWAV